MSKITKEKIKCDKCGNEFETQVYSSINVTLQPELKESIFKDEINHFVCPHCDSVIIKPFFYHDMNDKIMIWVWSIKDIQYKEEILKKFEEIKKTFEENIPDEMKESRSGYYEDIAFGIDDLQTKITNKR